MVQKILKMFPSKIIFCSLVEVLLRLISSNTRKTLLGDANQISLILIKRTLIGQLGSFRKMERPSDSKYEDDSDLQEVATDLKKLNKRNQKLTEKILKRK